MALLKDCDKSAQNIKKSLSYFKLIFQDCVREAGKNAIKRGGGLRAKTSFYFFE